MMLTESRPKSGRDKGVIMESFRPLRIWNWWKGQDIAVKIFWFFYAIPTVLILWGLIAYWFSHPLSFAGFLLFIMAFIPSAKVLKNKFPKSYWTREAIENHSKEERETYWHTSEVLAATKKEQDLLDRFTFLLDLNIYIFLVALILLVYSALLN